ncbi:MAG: urea transporter [Planctomycetes bacterium]|nr:urea transporter [Planctomycetota bacterium]
MPPPTPLRRRAARIAESLLRGYGQAFFCANPLSGALFALAILVGSPAGFLLSLVGLISATAAARFLRPDPLLERSGLYGFNGLLVGLCWGVFREQTPAGIALLAVAAALTAPLTAGSARILSRPSLDLPVLCLPSLAILYALLFAVRGLPGFEVTPGYLVWELDKIDLDVTGRLSRGEEVDWAAVRTAVTGDGAVMILLFLGVLVHSRILAGSAAGGLALSLAVSWLAGGNYALWNGALHHHVSIPLAMAIAGFFFALNPASVALAVLAVVVGVPAWHSLSTTLLAAGLPAWGTPFAAVCLTVLALDRIAPGLAARLGLARIPLAWAGRPEESAEWNRRFRFARRFWNEVEELRPGPAADGAERRLVQILLRSRRIVAFTGAGISTESGIPDYRTHEIAWKKYDARHFRFENFIASEESRGLYWEMSEDFFHLLRHAAPNGAHVALAELERLGKLERIVTQNVDRLHQRAGTSLARVIELHGNEMSVSCLACGKRYDRAEVHRWIEGGVRVPYCLGCQGILKPDSTAFGQPMPLEASRAALEAVAACDCLLVLGTSLEVQPAAYLPWKAKSNGASLVIVTKTPTRYDIHADVVLRENASAVLRDAVARLKMLMPLLDGVG